MRVFAAVLSVLAMASTSALAQPLCPGAGGVFSQRRITQYVGGFTGQLEITDGFGVAATKIGDLNGDGVPDLAVGAFRDDDGGPDRGAMWILLMNSNGGVQMQRKISSLEGNFGGALDDTDLFGISVAGIGDLNRDGVPDLAVGAIQDDDGGTDRGAVWILFMNANGTVLSRQKISNTAGTFGGALDNTDYFGGSVARIGDLDGDNVPDLAVGAYTDDDGGRDRGAIWILFMNTNGTVRAHQKISATAGGFAGVLDDFDNFGYSASPLGDVDSDGIADIVVGATSDDDGGSNRGAVWILFLNANGTVRAHQKISSTQGGFTGTLGDGALFGASMANLGDIDGDGVNDLAIASDRDDDSGIDRGSIWVLFMNANSTVRANRKISQSTGGFGDLLLDGGTFGRSLVPLGDLDGDGRGELVVGAHANDAALSGEVWVLSLNDCSIPPVITDQPDSILLEAPGELVTFSVAAQGSTPLTYRWRRNGVNLTNGGNIGGATTPTLIVFAGRADTARYDCVVSSAFGSITSAVAVLGIAQGCLGDFNDDGQVDFFDYLDFVQAFDAGC
jgi:hypothetical protein